MGYTLDSSGKPVYAATPTQTVVDLQAAVNFAKKYAYDLSGSSTARGLLPAGELWDGLVFYETDTDLTWRRGAGAWRLVSGALLRVVCTNPQSIPNNAETRVTFAAGAGAQDVVSVGQGLSLGGTGIVTVSIAGLYRVSAQGVWAAGGTANSHLLKLSRNGQVTGLDALASLDTTNLICTQVVEGVFQLAAGDTMELRAFQQSGGAKNLGVTGSSYYASMIIERVTE